MTNHTVKPFWNVSDQDEVEHLCRRVLIRIERREITGARRRLLVFGTLSVGAIVALFPAFQALYGGVVSSGFIEYLSLFVSGSSELMQNWQSVVMSAADAMPVGSFILFLIPIIVGLIAVRQFMQNRTSLSIFEHRFAYSALNNA